MIDLLFFYKGYIILLGIVLLCFTGWMVVDIIRYKKQKNIKVGDVTITQKPQNKHIYITIIACWVVMLSIAVLMIVDKIQDYKKYLDSLPEYRIWNSAYTEEEHIEEISTKMASIYGQDVEISIYTLYSFDNHPEYYLVEVPEKNVHRIILCYNDAYYDFHDESGPSWYANLNLLDDPECRLYAGYAYVAYEKDGKYYGTSIPIISDACDTDYRVELTKEQMQRSILQTDYPFPWWQKMWDRESK